VLRVEGTAGVFLCGEAPAPDASLCCIQTLITAYKNVAWFQGFHVDFSEKYDSVMAVCGSMKAAVRVLKHHSELQRELFAVLDASLPSLPFHGNLDIVRHCVRMAVNNHHL
jgi:hypothetical protein